MEPPDTRNLDMFLRRYERVQAYQILPVHLPDVTSIREPSWDLMIHKKEIFITPAWRLTDNDPDIVAMQKGDDPIVPDGVDASAILKRLKDLAEDKKR